MRDGLLDEIAPAIGQQMMHEIGEHRRRNDIANAVRQHSAQKCLQKEPSQIQIAKLLIDIRKEGALNKKDNLVSGHDR